MALMGRIMEQLMHFREITPADLPELFRVRFAAKENIVTPEFVISEGITVETCATMLRTTHRGWLCEFEGRIVGFAQGNRATGELWVIAVLPALEGRGIGRRLMQLVQDWLFSEGWVKLWLVTGPPPTRAYTLYRRLGWVDVGPTEAGGRRMELHKSL